MISLGVGVPITWGKGFQIYNTTSGAYDFGHD